MESLVSVIVPVFNGEKYVGEAIKSILSQTYRNLEIILVDDGSTDGSSEVLNEFALKDTRVRVLRKRNGGLSSARNHGMRACKGTYLGFLDADDIWLPTKIERQMQVFKLNPELGLVYCDNIYVNSEGIEIEIGGFRLDTNIQGSIFSDLIDANRVCGSGSGVLIAQSVFEEIGLFDETLQACEDWDMWLRISQKYCIKFVDEVLVKIRVHSEQMQKSSDKMFMARLALFAKHAEADIGREIFKNKIHQAINSSLSLKRYRLLNSENKMLSRKLKAILRQDGSIYWFLAILNSYVSGFARLAKRCLKSAKEKGQYG